MKTRDTICARVDGFLASSGMSAARFGLEAVGDHKFVKRLKDGAGITLTVIERAEAFMDAWPEGMPSGGQVAAE